MTALALLIHLANLVAPALFVALALATAAPWLPRKAQKLPAWRTRFAWLLAVGLACVVGGLLLFGVDGKMLTYAALVLASAATLGFMARRSG